MVGGYFLFCRLCIRFQQGTKFLAKLHHFGRHDELAVGLRFMALAVTLVIAFARIEIRDRL